MEAGGQRKSIPAALYFSIGSSVLLILITTFRWYLINTLIVFPAIFIGLFFIIILFMNITLSIIHIVRHVREDKFRAIIPLTIGIIALLIIRFVPLVNIAITLDFNMNFNDREKVVSMIKAGELQPNVFYNNSLISLPKDYAHLSKGGGEVVIEREGDRLKVLFFTFRGMLSGSTGFVYVSDDSGLYAGDFGTDFIQIKKKKENWYWMISE